MSFASMYGLLRTLSIACSPYVLKIRTARLVLTPWLCRNSMISRTCFASCHACAISSRRLGPMPSTVCSSADRVLDHGQNLGSESPDQLLRENRSDALDQAAAEITLDPLGGGRRHRLHDDGFELQPVLFVPDPPAFRAQPFPGAHGWQRSYDRRFIPLPACFNSQDTEAAFAVVE